MGEPEEDFYHTFEAYRMYNKIRSYNGLEMGMAPTLLHIVVVVLQLQTPPWPNRD